MSAGCADQPAQAVGNGLIDPPQGSVTVGTGGQVFAPLATPLFDPQLRLHTFCHAPEDRWYLLGAMLSAGMALRWLRQTLGGNKWSYPELDEMATEVEAGAEGLVFLPYLVGERSPLMDPRAKGAFIGLTLRHGPGHMVRALLEGVAFALRQIVDVMVAVRCSAGRARRPREMDSQVRCCGANCRRCPQSSAPPRPRQASRRTRRGRRWLGRRHRRRSDRGICRSATIRSKV